MSFNQNQGTHTIVERPKTRNEYKGDKFYENMKYRKNGVGGGEGWSYTHT